MQRFINTTSNRSSRPTIARKFRRGVTLLEALLATVILAAALASLSQLATNGINAALRIENETIAATKCQTKLDEILATNDIAIFGKEMSYPDEPAWTWRADLTAGATETLALLTVTVRRSGRSNGEATFRLSRLIRREELDGDRSALTSPGAT